MAVDTAKDALIRRGVLRSTASNYIGKIITLGTWFFLTPFILRQLGATSYGLWVLVGSVVAYGSLLDFGIAGAIAKYIAEYRAKGDDERARRIVATTLCLYTFLGLTAVALALLIAPFFTRWFNVAPKDQLSAMRLLILMGVSIGISLPCSTAFAVLNGLQRYDLSNLLSTIGLLLSAPATVLVLWAGGGVLGIVAVNIVVTLVMQIPSIRLIKRIAPELRFGWRGARSETARSILSFSSSLLIIGIAGRLQTQTDEIVIGANLPLSAVTPYAFARRLSEIPQILTDQFMRVLLPLASQLHAENDQARLRALYVTSTRLTLAIFLPVGGTLILLARPILMAWVGPSYGDYAYIVTILTLASFVVTTQWPAVSILQGMGRHRLQAVTSICTGIANLVLSIVLLRHLGLAGVALGTLIPFAVECLGILLPYTMHVLGVGVREVLSAIIWPTLAPIVPMLVSLYVLRLLLTPVTLFSLGCVGSVGVLVYAVGYLSLGANLTECQLCCNWGRATLRLARMRLKRA